MTIRCTRLLIVLICACAGLSGATLATASPYQAQAIGPATSQDGPLLPSELDPDDDDDGVADIDDSAPTDPTEGEAPEPGPTDPIADSDSDGLPNVMDPDDNNNGSPDAEDGVGTHDDPAPVPQPEDNGPSAPGTGSGSAHVSAAVGRAESQPLVRALPVTGSGTKDMSLPLPALLIGVTILLATGGISLRKTRR